ncbi:PT domain-containing protein [Patescibacteria group bacterium]|nr:PT domain-containing protein [Patescibacteria group bacterium]MBU4579769.1 PT domain-containing protein [Patescibacteria group bacterium]
MISDKISSSKIILAIVVLAALGAIAYSVALKKVPPVAVQPTVSPIITPQPTAMEPTLTPTPVITTEPTPNIDISDWKIYRNDKYGFEIKYPSGWIVREETEFDLSKLGNDNIIKASGTEFWLGLGTKNPPAEFFSLQVMNKSIDEAIAFDWTSFGKRTGKSIIIGGTEGEKLNGAFYGTEYVFYNGKTYFFKQFDSIDETDWEKYDRVISTFKFIK